MKTELIELDVTLRKNGTDLNDTLELQCQVLHFLIHQKVTKFHFPRDALKKQNYDAAFALWQKMEAEGPLDLHTIVAVNTSCADLCIAEPIFSMLHAFRNLEVLQLDMLCRDEDLVSIAEHLPKLR